FRNLSAGGCGPLPSAATNATTRSVLSKTTSATRCGHTARRCERAMRITSQSAPRSRRTARSMTMPDGLGDQRLPAPTYEEGELIFPLPGAPDKLAEVIAYQLWSHHKTPAALDTD